MLKQFGRILIAAAAVFAVIGGLALIKKQEFAAMAAQPNIFPPTLVTSAVAADQDWIPTVDVVGSLTAVKGVMLAPEMDGKVVRIDFESGASVKAGAVLVQLDVESEQAQLRAAEATADLARISRDRERKLLDSHTVAQSEFDAADAQCKQAAAQVDNIRSIIDKKTIRAPFAGRAGIRLVNLGQILHAGDPVVSLQSLDPIYVDFLVPQQYVDRLAPGLKVEVGLDIDTGHTRTGSITAMNPDVDSATRNVRVRATLDNPRELLRPGMYANVSVLLPGRGQVLAIPQTAVLYAPYGDSVFIVETKNGPDGKPQKSIHQQFVTLGEKRGDFVAVTGGLKAGEEVVSTGVFKLRTGMPVVVDNSKSPQFQLDPHPGNS